MASKTNDKRLRYNLLGNPVLLTGKSIEPVLADLLATPSNFTKNVYTNMGVRGNTESSIHRIDPLPGAFQKLNLIDNSTIILDLRQVAPTEEVQAGLIKLGVACRTKNDWLFLVGNHRSDFPPQVLNLVDIELVCSELENLGPKMLVYKIRHPSDINQLIYNPDNLFYVVKKNGNKKV